MGDVLDTGTARPAERLPDGREQATVLFVDDEPWVVSGLGRVLRQARPGWRAIFAVSGEEALGVLADQAVDVVVSDIRMPGMNGVQLLTAVQEYYPGVARLVLSGYADQDLVIAAVGPAQEFLTKPIASEDLVQAVERALGLNGLVDDPRLRAVLGPDTDLPGPPRMFQMINQVIADPDHDLDDVVGVIAADAATSAEVLRLVSSPVLQFPAPVNSVAEAVARLGLATVKSLAIAAEAFAAQAPLPPGLDAAALAEEGLRVAHGSRRIASAEDWPAPWVADVFTAGLLHRIGLPVLARSHPREWAALSQLPEPDPWTENDRFVQQFGCSLSRASAYLLGSWGFPEPVVEAVAGQPAGPHASPAAHVLTYARHVVRSPGVPYPVSRGDYLDADRLARWRSLLPDHEPGTGPGAARAR